MSAEAIQTPESTGAPAVRVERVSREFEIEHGAGGTLKHTVLGRARGRKEHFRALDDVSLDIPRGGMFALVGHNGSGKSTLLKLIAGIYPPTRGAVQVGGRVTALLELGAGFHPELSGRENAYLAGAIAGLSRRQVDENIEAVKAFTGLKDFFESPVKVYSSGMFVRLGFAVAVHLDPEILIVDEVVAVGDEEFQRQCFDHLRKLRRKGVTIIFVTHSLALVEQLADGAAWLDHGKLKAIGPARDVVDAYLADVNQRERDGHDPTRAGAGGIPADQGDQPPSESDPAAAEAAPTDSDERFPQRWGSGAARVVDVEFVDALGQTTEAIAVGDPLTIRIRYSCVDPLVTPNFGLAIWSEQGWPIAAPNTRLADHSTGSVDGNGHVDFAMPACPFVPGVISVTAAITDHSTTEVYDWVERGWELRVMPGRGFGPTGLVVLDGSWTGPTGPIGPTGPTGPAASGRRGDGTVQ